jgi:hypothetical protein
MTESVSLELLPVALVIQQAHHEFGRLLRQQPREGAYALELFRRALVLQDELAWSGIYELYHGLPSWPISDAVLAAQEVWQIINSEVTSWQERLILRAVYALGLSPRELQQRYPLVFPTVADIYRIKRKVLERLRRNRELQALLHG